MVLKVVFEFTLWDSQLEAKEQSLPEPNRSLAEATTTDENH